MELIARIDLKLSNLHSNVTAYIERRTQSRPETKNKFERNQNNMSAYSVDWHHPVDRDLPWHKQPDGLRKLTKAYNQKKSKGHLPEAVALGSLACRIDELHEKGFAFIPYDEKHCFHTKGKTSKGEESLQQAVDAFVKGVCAGKFLLELIGVPIMVGVGESGTTEDGNNYCLKGQTCQITVQNAQGDYTQGAPFELFALQSPFSFDEQDPETEEDDSDSEGDTY